MTWLDRILATPCPLPSCGAFADEYCDRERGQRPARPASPPYFHASRIQAADGAAPARRRRHDWRYLAVGAACNACGTRRKSVAPMMFRYSTDNGATWTPGPSVCPGEEAVTLKWNKSSFKRYVAELPDGVCLEVVRSGRRYLLNERWHPWVFGNPFASREDFATWHEAAEQAERLALVSAAKVLSALGGRP